MPAERLVMLRFLGRLHENAIHARRQEASEKPQHKRPCASAKTYACGLANGWAAPRTTSGNRRGVRWSELV